MSRSPLQSQQNQWRTATKRQILGNFSAKPTSCSIDGSNADHVKMMIDELEGKFDQIVAFLKSDLDDCKLEQEEALSTGLIKLPKAIRNMTVREFNQQHGCDLLALLKSKDGVVMASSASGHPKSASAAALVDTTGKKRDHQMAVTETPAPRTRPNNNQVGSLTALRTARRGEGLL
jgi:hypothetical protein